MDNLMCMDLPSSDEDDVDFIDKSAHTHTHTHTDTHTPTHTHTRALRNTGENPQPRNKHTNIHDDKGQPKWQQDLKQKKQKEKIEDLYMQLVEEDKLNGRDAPPHADKFMLQFHKRYSHTQEKQNKTAAHLYRHLQISVSNAQPYGDSFDRKHFKQSTREPTSEDVKQQIQQAIAPTGSKDVKVDVAIKFAGKVYNVTETVSTDSQKFKSISKKQSMEVGGSLKSLSDMMNQVENKTTVTSVEKSYHDWKDYKDQTGIEESLSTNRKDGYIAKQSFLSAVAAKEYENEIETKKRRVNL